MKEYKFAKFININGKYKAYNNQEELIELYADGLNDLQSKIDKVIKLCETEKKYIYDDVKRDGKTGKLLYGNKIELDIINKNKILNILKGEDK